MSRYISVLLTVFFINVCAFAQTEKYSAPVKWERYKTGDGEVSVLLPKMPTANLITDVCGEQKINKYTAYAENVIYGLNTFAKLKQKAPDSCGASKKFDEQSFVERLKELKSSQTGTEEETKFNQNGFEVVKIANETFNYWLINDANNQRWFELWTANTDEKNVSVENFIKSVEIGKNPSGIEIGNGSLRILGDETSTGKIEPIKSQTAILDKEPVKIKFIVKPKASYTDVARQNDIQGTVRLKVTFLASGGIGSIEPVIALPYGLTEQAIAAAAKIAFIPARKNGVPTSITSIVEYSFNIY